MWHTSMSSPRTFQCGGLFAKKGKKKLPLAWVQYPQAHTHTTHPRAMDSAERKAHIEEVKKHETAKAALGALGHRRHHHAHKTESLPANVSDQLRDIEEEMEEDQDQEARAGRRTQSEPEPVLAQDDDTTGLPQKVSYGAFSGESYMDVDDYVSGTEMERQSLSESPQNGLSDIQETSFV
eukprot:m.111902 g.111902  ORF g.111902 m.111902 type:complete len:180 (-) comp19256_c0_seq8:183-722(-)